MTGRLALVEAVGIVTPPRRVEKHKLIKIVTPKNSASTLHLLALDPGFSMYLHF